MNAAVLGLKLLIGGDTPRPPPSLPLPLTLLQVPVPVSAATAEGATTLLPTHTHSLASTHPATHALTLPYTLPPDVAETIADIDTACRAAVDILNDLLTFEKLER